MWLKRKIKRKLIKTHNINKLKIKLTRIRFCYRNRVWLKTFLKNT